MTKPALVLLHGWGNDSSSWQPVINELEQYASVTCLDLPGFGSAPLLEEFTLESVLPVLEKQLPSSCVLMGWSLGGMLAVQLAARCPQQVVGVITLAANAKFVAADDYTTAMAPAINRQFNAQFAQEPLATLKLFSGLLAQGDDQERTLLKKLRLHLPKDIHINRNWQEALQLLAELDNRTAFAALQQPGLHILGEKDALVPADAVHNLRQLNAAQELVVLPGVAHALHWSQPETLVNLVADFLNKHALSSAATTPSAAHQLDKKKIAQSFSRAAETYDGVADLQRAVSHRLLEHVQFTAQSIVLDLGSGTGNIAAHFATQVKQVVAVDIAQGMLKFARAHHSAPVVWICGDAENLPLASESVDLVFSSLAIQWCNELPKLMAELQRVVKPGGRIYLSTLGPDSLRELKLAWQQVDNYVHVNDFASEALVTEAIGQAGLELELFECNNQVIYFDSLGDLTHSLKALGAHNMNPGQPTGLMGRKQVQAFKNAYDTFRTPAGLPLTYDVFYVIARKHQTII